MFNNVFSCFFNIWCVCMFPSWWVRNKGFLEYMLYISVIRLWEKKIQRNIQQYQSQNQVLYINIGLIFY